MQIRCRCTVCGESTEIMSELPARTFGKTTGLSIDGQPLNKPLHELKLDNVLKADEFVNEQGEKGGRLYTWFKAHSAQRTHRVRCAQRVAH